ncbi:thioredoxin family protein [Methanococcoides burtonii]|uniref:Thioredoxin n=1 Tax=Methanococcoides burtonii (strain DSM 6242 / NBRC 107633 / OCM 468 / ACE-M) TaxID=259564 RepID=Q12XE1_METBU|nr:thioredoxin family protein [Methanococcoides burtonii]ABE51885.1 Thioredoxin [Methanococcoides burtonii DSM 6242]
MKIEILGSGCAKCNKLKELVEKVVNENSINAEITKVEDINKILEYGVMITPGLVIDGDVKIAGKIPSEDKVREWLTQ